MHPARTRDDEGEPRPITGEQAHVAALPRNLRILVTPQPMDSSNRALENE